MRVSTSLAVVNANPDSSALALSETSVCPLMVHTPSDRPNRTYQTLTTSNQTEGTRKASEGGPHLAASTDVVYEKDSSRNSWWKVSTQPPSSSTSCQHSTRGVGLALTLAAEGVMLPSSVHSNFFFAISRPEDTVTSATAAN